MGFQLSDKMSSVKIWKLCQESERISRTKVLRQGLSSHDNEGQKGQCGNAGSDSIWIPRKPRANYRRD